MMMTDRSLADDCALVSWGGGPQGHLKVATSRVGTTWDVVCKGVPPQQFLARSKEKVPWGTRGKGPGSTGGHQCPSWGGDLRTVSGLAGDSCTRGSRRRLRA